MQPLTSGIVQIPKDARVGILDQNYFCFENKKISERKEERKERNRLKREIENLEKEIEKSEREIEKIDLILSAPIFMRKRPLVNYKRF